MSPLRGALLATLFLLVFAGCESSGDEHAATLQGVYSGPDGCIVVAREGRVVRFALTLHLGMGNTTMIDRTGSWPIVDSQFSFSDPIGVGTLTVAGTFRGTEEVSGSWQLTGNQSGSGSWSATSGGTQTTVEAPVVAVVEEGRAFKRVTLTSATEGATVRYTLDGTLPTSPNVSPLSYSAPIVISKALKLQAVAEHGGAVSEVVSQDFTFAGADEPMTASSFAKTLGTADDDGTLRLMRLDAGYGLVTGGVFWRLKEDFSFDSARWLELDFDAGYGLGLWLPAKDGSIDFGTFQMQSRRLSLSRTDSAGALVYSREYDLARADLYYHTEPRQTAVLRRADGSLVLGLAHESRVGVLHVDATGRPASFTLYGSGVAPDAIEAVTLVKPVVDELRLVAEYAKTGAQNLLSYLVMSLKADGSVGWARRIDTGLADNLNFHTTVDWSESAEGVRLAFSQTNAPEDGGRVLIVRLDAAQSLAGAWKVTGLAEPKAVTTDDGGLLVGGTLNRSEPPYGDLVLAALDVAQSVSWAKSYGGNGSDYLASVVPLATGGAIVSAKSWSFGAGGADVWLLKLDAGGGTPVSNAALRLAQPATVAVATVAGVAVTEATLSAETKTITVTVEAAIPSSAIKLNATAPLASVQYP